MQNTDITHGTVVFCFSHEKHFVVVDPCPLSDHLKVQLDTVEVREAYNEYGEINKRRIDTYFENPIIELKKCDVTASGDPDKRLPNMFSVPEHRLVELAVRFDKLAKTAKKLGVAAPTYCLTGRKSPQYVTRGNANGLFVGMVDMTQVDYYNIELVVCGETPKLPGDWKLVAKIEHHPDFPKPLITTVPHEACPAEFREVAPGRCDHCNANRTRKHSFVLRDADDEHVVVGRTCIADFLGGVSPSDVARYASYIDTLDDIARDLEADDVDDEAKYLNTLPKWDRSLDLHNFLVATACVIKIDGYASRTSTQFTSTESTSSKAMSLLFPPMFLGPNAEQDRLDYEAWVAKCAASFTADDVTRIDDATAYWVEAGKDENPGEYAAVLSTLALAGKLTGRFAGYAASMLPSYQRHLERENAAEAKQTADAGKLNQHVGTIKERLRELPLSFVGESWFEGQFGSTQIVRMEDDKGRLFIWFNTGRGVEANISDTLVVTGTVKDHSEYNGRSQTVLSRCKIANTTTPLVSDDAELPEGYTLAANGNVIKED